MGWAWLEELIYGAKNREITTLKSRVEQLEKDKIVLRENLQDAEACLEETRFQLFEAEKQITLLTTQVEALNKWLDEAIQIPDITQLINLETAKLVDPYTVESLNGYYLTVADPQYYTFPKETWQLILDLVHKEVKEMAGAWKRNIFDCDNFSNTTQDIASIAFMNAKLSYQGAIMIAWSGVHAYNIILDIDNVGWVYEPQTNEIIGKLGETTNPYDTRLLWIPT